MQALNFSSQARDCLNNMSQMMYKRIGRTAASQFMDWVSHKLDQSVKFILPDNGRLLEDSRKVSPAKMSLFKLPFPVVAIEFEAPGMNNNVAENFHASYRRIGLAFEMNKLPADELELLYYFAGRKFSISPDEIGMLTIYDAPGEDRPWLPALGFLVIDPNEPLMASKEALELDDEHTFKAGVGKPHPYALSLRIFPMIAGRHLLDAELDQIAKSLQYDCVDELGVLIDFTSVINCRNVTTDLLKAPEKLNQKRIKSGKLPLYDYHLLSVGGDTAANTGAASGAGSHNSPRMHLRRGHIRLLHGSQRPVWVNAAVVGRSEQGLIDKTYVVDAG